MNVLSKLFGGLETTSIAFVEARAFWRSDAVLVDVREKGEWAAGLRGSLR